MIHDPELIEQIQRLPHRSFNDNVFRATGINSDPTAFSTSGGRWAIPEGTDGGFSILYTSLVREGAIAEVASYLGLLNPIPKKPLKVHTISVSVDQAIRVAVGDFAALGIDPNDYSSRNYERTQLVGAAINFLELDGLLAPSARWQCENLMIFANNHPLDATLDAIDEELIPFTDWQALGGPVSSTSH